MLKNQVALITGASKGIGKAIALTLAAQGANIIVNYRGLSSRKGAQEVVAEIKKLGVKAEAIQGDVSCYQESQILVKTALANFGQIDILVNNAGITRDNLIMMMQEEQFDQVIKVNLKGVFNMIHHVSKPMIKARQGVIINLSSVVGIAGNAGQINYAASKAGVIGMTKTVARELGKRNIRCNAVAPGFIKTDMTANLPPRVLEEVQKQCQLNRLGEVVDVANAVLFLASPQASYITGQVLQVDGGMVI